MRISNQQFLTSRVDYPGLLPSRQHARDSMERRSSHLGQVLLRDREVNADASRFAPSGLLRKAKYGVPNAALNYFGRHF